MSPLAPTLRRRLQTRPTRLMCAAVTVAVTLLSACSNKRHIEWNEEVLLESGERLMTRRTALSQPFGQIGGPGGWENEGMTLEITAPVKPDNPTRWSAKFVPLILDRDNQNGEWFIVATFYSCTSWYELDRPKLPYTEFRFRQGRWVQQALSPKFIGRDANMLTDVQSNGEQASTIEAKRSRMNDPRMAPEYKRVVEKWSTNC
mgnify:CR=1 FL=1